VHEQVSGMVATNSFEISFRYGRAIAQADADSGDVGIEIGGEFFDLHASIYRLIKCSDSAG